MTAILNTLALATPGNSHLTGQNQPKIIKLIPLIEETIRVLLEAHDDAHEAIKVMSILRHKRVEAQARYVHTHAHSRHCYSSIHRIIIDTHIHSPLPENAAHIAHIIEERRLEPSDALSSEEYLQWTRGLVYTGIRGQFLKLMEPGFPGRPIVASIHEQIVEFLGATKHLDRYLLN